MRTFSTILLGSLAALSVPSAQAALFSVNNEADVPDDNVGDGICHAELGLPGVCTLRAAVQEANASAGADMISLSAGQTYTLTRVAQEDAALNGDLDLDDNVTILFFASGERPVVDAGGVERAFEIHTGNATLFGFDITGGDATLDSDQGGGGIAVNFDAGIVQLSFLRLYGNRANFGGGLYNDGANTTLSSSELYDNEAQDDFTNSGGSAILNRGSLSVDHSSVFANAGVAGLGAIAIENHPPFTGSPTLTLINSTVATNLGIGINSQDESTLVVRNSTIVGNSSVGIRIGGVDGTFQMRNSVVAQQGSDDCVISIAANLNLDRYNMDSDDSCELADGTSNYPGVDPKLTPLARHGGFTHASWPLTISPTLEQAHPVIGAIELSDDVIFFDPYEQL